MSSELKKASVGTAFIGGIFIFLLFGVIVLVWLRTGGKQEDFDDQRAVARAAKLDVMQKENHEKLTTYAWVNKAKGVVQLPVDRAMELVIADLKAKPVKASAVKLEVPYPAGLQAPLAAPAGSGTAAPGAAVSGTNTTTTGTAAPAAPATASGTAAPATTTGTLSPTPAAAPSPAAPSVTTTPAP